MADSKFLPFQDANGDNLPDVCPETELAPDICLKCSPNPLASVPNWKKRKHKTPFLNEKLCKYQIPYRTQTTATFLPEDLEVAIDPSSTEAHVEAAAQRGLQAQFERYMDPYTDNQGKERDGAIKRILIVKNKEVSEETMATVRENLEYTDYYLDARPGSYLKILYSIDFDVIEDLPDALPEEEPPEAGDIVVEYDAHDMVMMGIRVRKGLNLYGRYYAVYRVLEGSNLIFIHNRKIFDLSLYGDDALLASSQQLAQVMTQLDAWLNVKGYNIPSLGSMSFFKERITKMEFTFNSEYKLKKLKVWTSDCGEYPQAWSGSYLSDLRARSAWKDKTAVAYFAQLKQMDSALSARVERPWIDVVTEFTYPKVMPQLHAGVRDVEDRRDVPGCIADALANEMKVLGQDILDEVFSIGDAIAYAFHKNLCRHDPTEVNKDNVSVGKVFGIPEIEDGNNLWGAAIMQAHKEIDPRDQIFAHFCLYFLTSPGVGEGCPPMGPPGSSMQMLDSLWAGSLERIKMCGFLDLLGQVVKCLLGGLSFEEALRKMLQSALKAMGIEDFGELFVGLPPDKQWELEELVKEKLKKGPILPDSHEYESETGKKEGANPLFGGDGEGGISNPWKVVRPWENPEVVARQKDSMRNNNGEMVPTKAPGYDQDSASKTRRTLAQSFAVAQNAEDFGGMDPNNIMDAYLLALLEIFQDNLMGLLDLMNKFPGAQIVALLISTIDCPRPPLFNPGVMDFIKSLSLPFCRGKQEIVLPRFENPFVWLPKFKDIMIAIWEMVKILLKQLVVKIIVMILVKVCELIGDAICKALELAGAMAASLPSVIAGKQKFGDVIKDAVCGPDADDDTVNSTVTQLMSDLGVGGQALSNPDRALSYLEDVSAAITQQELMEAVLGNASPEMLSIADQIRENEYPEYNDALPNEASIGSFFSNVGKLFPAQFKSELKDLMRDRGDDALPANPSMCATPEAIEDFKNLRCQLLEGRVSPEQCDEMFEKWRGTLLDDLGEMSDIAQKGLGNYVADQLPPMFSDPGCENGMLPYEPEENIIAATNALKKDMDKLKIAFSSDMLENGPGPKKWGFINMVMSDTLGNPYTVHQRKTANRAPYVDFYLDPQPPGMSDDDFEDAVGLDMANLPQQKAAYPIYIADYLMYQFQKAGKSFEDPSDPATTYDVNDLEGSMVFNSSNAYQLDKYYKRSFKKMGVDSGDVDIIAMPSPGYNVDVVPHVHDGWDGGGYVSFIRNLRKDEPDIKLEFKDNASGQRLGPDGGQCAFGYGFELSCFFSDLYRDGEYKNSEGDWVDGPVKNRPGDNVRIYIAELFNQDSDVYDPAASMIQDNPDDPNPKKNKKEKEEEKGVLKTRRFEFLTYDDSLDDINLEDYPNLAASFDRLMPSQPQVLALFDLFDGRIEQSTLKDAYDSFMTNAFEKVSAEIGKNKTAWSFGAEYDNLSYAQFEYVVPKGTKLVTGSPGDSISSRDVEVQNYNNKGDLDGKRPIREEDGILGVSLDQYENGAEARVVYLDPVKYGGSYMNPPLYVKPLTGSGWTGVVDILFPELAPCKPKTTDLVNFKEVQDKIDQLYPKLTSDTRLQSDPDCIVEVPYARVLDRPAKAGLMGAITATIKMFVSVHFLKSLATFTTFAPKFPENYSNIYAAYIIEQMEEQLKSAGTAFLSAFQDYEFWYAFLEQSVQLYGLRIGPEGDIPEEDVPEDVQAALNRLDDLQDSYDYPSREDKIQDPDSPWFETLKSYRESKNLEAVFYSSEDAKLILKELVKEELKLTGERFIKNLRPAGFKPVAEDLGYYYMSTFSNGSELNLDGKIAEAPFGLPTPEDPDPTMQGYSWPGPFYSEGNEFTTTDDKKYVGYYHGEIDPSDGGLVYKKGPPTFLAPVPVADMEPEDQEQLLRPFASKTIMGLTSSAGFVGIGDIPSIVDSVGGTSQQPFTIKKYIKIGGALKDPDAAAKEVREKVTGNISDHWPGTMRLVYPPLPPAGTEDTQSSEPKSPDAGGTVNLNRTGTAGAAKEDKTMDPVGVDGELGVRYGIQFSMRIGDTDEVITRVEVDALDIPVSAFNTLQRDSKLLLCLLQLLKEDPKYKLVVDYVFSFKKVLAILAIYNDMAFTPSIGEWTVGPGQMSHPLIANVWPATPGSGVKPGKYANITYGEVDVDGEDVPFVRSVELIDGAPGWARWSDRAGGYQWDNAFFLQYHEWDQQTLRRSIRLLRKMFRIYYHSRKWDPGDDDNGAVQWLEQLRARFKMSPGARFLPWWKKNRLRGNPYNADGELCDKAD